MTSCFKKTEQLQYQPGGNSTRRARGHNDAGDKVEEAWENGVHER